MEGGRSIAENAATTPTPPTHAQVMRRPRWLALLVLAIAIAGGFAWLGHWQLSSAVVESQAVGGETETERPLADIIEPGEQIPEAVLGARASASGTLLAENTSVVEQRVNGGVTGAWVIGVLDEDRPADADPRSIAVALGWAPDAEAAERAAAEVRAGGDRELTVSGRAAPSEAPELDDDNPELRTTLSVAWLVNDWTGLDDARPYPMYLISDAPPAGLDAIDAPPPLTDATVNWLNLFYAVEWVVFAGFAIFIWFRLTRDSWENEVEELTGVDPREERKARRARRVD